MLRIGVIRQCAIVDIVLRNRVIGCADFDLIRDKVPRETRNRTDLIVDDLDRVRQGDITRIFDFERIGNHLTHGRIGRRCRRLAHFQGRVGIGRNGFRIWCGRGGPVGRRRNVGDDTNIQMILRNHEVSRTGQTIPWCQAARRQGRTINRRNPVIRHADRCCDRNVTRIGDDILIAHNIAWQVEVDRGCRLVDFKLANAGRKDALLNRWRCDIPVSSGRQIRHRTRINIGLRDRIITRAGDRRARRKTAAWQGRTANSRDFVIRNRDRICQRDVTRIGHIIFVRDDVARHVECLAQRALNNGKGWALIRRDTGCVRGGACATTAGDRDIRDHAGVQIRLSNHISRRTGQGGIQGQTASRQGRAVDRCNLIIGNRDRVCQRHITRIAHIIAVGEHITHGVESAVQRRFCHAKIRILSPVHSLRDLRRACSRNAGCRQIGDRPRIHIGLSDRVRRRTG